MNNVDGKSSRETSAIITLTEMVNAIVGITYQINGNEMTVGVGEGAINDIDNSFPVQGIITVVESPNCKK